MWFSKKSRRTRSDQEMDEAIFAMHCNQCKGGCKNLYPIKCEECLSVMGTFSFTHGDYQSAYCYCCKHKIIYRSMELPNRKCPSCFLEEGKEYYMEQYQKISGHKEFSRLPLLESEEVSQMCAGKEHIVIVTTKGRIFTVDKDGKAEIVTLKKGDLE